MQVRYNIHTMQKHKLLEKLEDKRRQLGISKEKFAVKKLDISYSTYHRWLNERFNPNLETIEQIKKVLNENSQGGD